MKLLYWIKFLLRYVSWRCYFPRKGSIAHSIKNAPKEFSIEIKPRIYDEPIYFCEGINLQNDISGINEELLNSKDMESSDISQSINL